MTAWLGVPPDSVQLSGASPASYRPADATPRHFCAVCGTTLFIGDTAPTAHSVAACTLDDPASVTPRVHRSIDTQLPWLKMNDLLPVYEGTRPPPPHERTYWRKPKNNDVTRSSHVELRVIDDKNLRDTLLLDVQGAQRRFVALNSTSLAQAQFDPRAWHRVIYADNTAVGFVMMTRDTQDMQGLPTKDQPFLWRFMIDEQYQGLGFGRRALALAVEVASTWGTPQAFWTSAVPGAGSPMEFYRRLGFEDTGVVDDGELVLRLDLPANIAAR